MGPGAVAAAKHLAVRAATVATSPGVTSATLSALVIYWAFQKLPDWVKKDISFRNLLKNRTDVSTEELEGLYSVVEKLRNVAGNIQELDIDIPQLHAALLAFVQLSGQIKIRQIEDYRSVMSDGGDERTGDDCDTDTTRQVSDDQQESANDASACSIHISAASACVSEISPVTSTRDSLYETAGDLVELSRFRSNEIQNALRLATFAYYESSETLEEKLQEREFTLLHHKLVDIRPGRVAHYIATSPIERRVVIGLRGTSTLGDLLTDCCGHAVPLVVDDDAPADKVRVEIQAAVPSLVVTRSDDQTMEVISGHDERIVLEDHDDDGDNYIRCHEGILISARNVLDEIEAYLFPLIECHYEVVLCGHSLGGGTAVLLATLLRSKYPELFLGSQPKIHAYAFGAPPVLDHDSAIAAAGYCTSIINNADLISRLNITNLAVSLACLRTIQRKLVENDMSPTGPVTSVAFFNKIAEGTSGTLLMTPSELDETLREAHDNLALRKPEHLFVPGKVLLVYNPWLDGGEEELDDDSIATGSASAVGNLLCVETTGTSPVFQRLELDGIRCFTDHLTSSYFEILGMTYEF
eukprot:jgi/Psemu1/236880/estExt_Genewise1.C_570071